MRSNTKPMPRGPLQVRIVGVGSYLPARRITNEEIASQIGGDPLWAHQRLGIKERRIAAGSESTSDLATQAAERALATAKTSTSDVGMVVLATTTPDRQAPSTACRVSQRLGIQHAPAFDVAAACSGFVYALVTAAYYLHAGFRETALVIGADTISRITDWSSRDCVYFGDGAGAVILKRSPTKEAVLFGELAADPSGYDHFTVRPGQRYFSMNGGGVFDSAKQLVSELTQSTLASAGLVPDEIDHVIPHQPSVNLLKAISSEVGIPFHKFWLHMDRFGNTAAATVPIALDEATRSGTVRLGDWLLLAAAGAGMTSGVALYRWH